VLKKIISISFAGVLMNRNILSLSLLSLTLCACSGTNVKQAAGDFEYAKKSENKRLVIPKGLEKPKESKDYFITSNVNKGNPVGENLDIRGPSLVLPVVSSSRTELNSGKAKIWFDRVLDDRDFTAFIVESLKGKLAVSDVELITIDEENLVFESSWFSKEKKAGFWMFESIESSESIRFRYDLEAKPHGRSIAVTVSLIDFMKTNLTGGSKSIDPIDKQRAEMKMLNELIAFIGYKYKDIQKEMRLERANHKVVTIGENIKKEPAYIVEMELDALWSNMPEFFEKHGFTINDLNKTNSIFYVSFEKPDTSFWSQIWGEEEQSIELANAKYQFILKRIDTKSSVSIYDEQGNSLSKDLLTKIFPALVEGLSFKNL